MYKTETHLHVAQISPCGKIGAREMIELYKKAGYHTVFVSDHFIESVLRGFGEISWREKVDKFFEGYEIAKKAGEALGINVLPAAELTYNYSCHDFLLYGFDKSFFYELPDIFEMPKKAVYKYAKAHGVTVVQAHPYRDGVMVPDSPDIMDAIEAYNSNPRHENYTEKVLAYAKEHNLPITCGSDAHRYEDVGRGGVISEEEIKTPEDYVRLLMSGKLEMIQE